MTITVNGEKWDIQSSADTPLSYMLPERARRKESAVRLWASAMWRVFRAT